MISLIFKKQRKALKKLIPASILLMGYTGICSSMTGSQLADLINTKNYMDNIAAEFYILGVADSLHEISFCKPSNFEPGQILGALQITIKRTPMLHRLPGTFLVREVLINLSPCGKKSKKNECICPD